MSALHSDADPMRRNVLSKEQVAALRTEGLRRCEGETVQFTATFGSQAQISRRDRQRYIQAGGVLHQADCIGCLDCKKSCPVNVMQLGLFSKKSDWLRGRFHENAVEGDRFVLYEFSGARQMYCRLFIELDVDAVEAFAVLYDVGEGAGGVGDIACDQLESGAME